MNRRAPAPPPKSSTTGRTVVLVAVASAVAAFILGRAFSNNNKSNSNSTTKTTTAAKLNSKTSTTIPSAVTTPPVTTPPTIAPSAIKVLVLNANGIQGTAGKRSTELIALGYSQSSAADAVQNNIATSAVYYSTADYQAAATALATKIGVAAVSAAPPPDKLAKDPAKLTGVNVVLLLGKDIADKAIAAAPAAATTVAPTAAAAATTTTTVKK